MRYKKPLLSSLSIIVLLLISPINALAQTNAAVATLFSLEGTGFVLKRGEKDEKPVAVGDSFYSGDRIHITKQSRAGLQFQDGGFVRLGSNATLTFQHNEPADKVEIAQGNAFFFSRSPTQYPEITTPTVSAAMRGTEFSVSVAALETIVAVLEGSVELSNAQGNALLKQGEGARVKSGEAPTKELMINLPDTVQWMVRVPFIGDWSDYSSQGNSYFAEALQNINEQKYIAPANSPEWISRFVKAAELVKQEKFNEALDQIGQTPKQAELQLLKARILLSTGEIKEGSEILNSLSKSANPTMAESAQASLALGALSKGDIQAAKSLIDSGSNNNNFSRFAVRSLITQAERDIDTSIEQLDQALALYPNSTALTTRKAELALASGELDIAQDYIDQSLSRDNSGYTNLIAGFIDLAKGERESASSHFAKARNDRTTAAYALLGQGLVSTVEGEQAKGIELFQQAVLLDPKSSFLRSYLGKAFSEANKEGMAENEYQQAIDLDPNDPTPWIYRSYSRIAQNRPVDALDDIEESIERNDNRAIFRSSFLLDQDSAVRSANLARVFNELGFSDAGRIEAIKSINKQYTNFSAHRLLSETENTIFLADASLSERRISDLMAPLSLNLFDSISGNVTLNEYSALFEKDQTRFALGGDYSSVDDLYAPAFLVAGKENTLGYAFSAGGINRDGTAQGNNNQDYRISSMVQYQPSWRNRLSLQTTGQYVLTRDANAYEQNADLKRYGVDFGLLHTFEPGVVGLFSSSFQRSYDYGEQYNATDEILSTQIFEGMSDSVPAEVLLNNYRDTYLSAVQNQAQFIVDGKYLSTVAGASLVNLRDDRFDDQLVLEDSLGELTGLGVQLPNSQENQLTSSTLYTYETAHITDWLHLTAGMAYETVERDLREIPAFIQGTETNHKLSPKFGAVINPLKSLTVRGSYVEGLRKSALEDQISIEPTMVGGINQRFNDLSGTENRQYGAGIDWKDAKSTYAGVEWTRRHITEPISFTTSEFIVDFDNETSSNTVNFDGTNYYHGEQDFLRGYFSQVITDQVVATIDNRYTKQRFTDPDSYERIADNRTAATLKYFDSTGLILFTRALWRYQDQTYVEQIGDDSESFWNFDLGVGYRLMERKGIVRLEFRNIFDEDFTLNQTTGFDDFLAPSRSVYLTARFNY